MSTWLDQRRQRRDAEKETYRQRFAEYEAALAAGDPNYRETSRTWYDGDGATLGAESAAAAIIVVPFLMLSALAIDLLWFWTGAHFVDFVLDWVVDGERPAM